MGRPPVRGGRPRPPARRAALVARGEFSLVIAGLGVGAGVGPRLGPLSAAYVLLLAVLGPTLARAAAARFPPAAPGPGEAGPGGHRP